MVKAKNGEDWEVDLIINDIKYTQEQYRRSDGSDGRRKSVQHTICSMWILAGQVGQRKFSAVHF